MRRLFSNLALRVCECFFITTHSLRDQVVYLFLGDDHGQNIQEIKRHSPQDADNYERYHHDLKGFNYRMEGVQGAVRLQGLASSQSDAVV